MPYSLLWARSLVSVGIGWGQTAPRFTLASFCQSPPHSPQLSFSVREDQQRKIIIWSSEEMDTEVVNVYCALQPMLVNQRAPTDRLLISLALLALCRLNPDSGYLEGKQLVRGFLEHQGSQGAETLGRASFALSWLAIRAGEYGAAHGSLPSGGQRRRVLSLNLEIAALCHLNRCTNQW